RTTSVSPYRPSLYYLIFFVFLNDLFGESMARGNDDTLVIRRPAQLRAIGSPSRVVILEHLLGRSPQSIREVALVIGRPPAALYHHFRVLTEAGLVVEAGSRGAGRKAEQLYRAAASRVRAAIDPRSAAERTALARTGEVHARHALR